MIYDERQVEQEMEWLRAFKAGNQDAFTQIVEAYQRPVYNLCYRLLGNPEEAEDAAQETFLRAYRNFNKYDEDRKFSTWMLSIASHYCIDQLRKRRYTVVSMDDMPFVQIEDKAPGPERQAVDGERQQQVQTLLGSLNPTDRAAVVMRYWYELSYEEIAETLNLTNSAVKSRLHRARQILAGAWEQQEQVHSTAQRNPYGARIT